MSSDFKTRMSEHLPSGRTTQFKTTTPWRRTRIASAVYAGGGRRKGIGAVTPLPMPYGSSPLPGPDRSPMPDPGLSPDPAGCVPAVGLPVATAAGAGVGSGMGSGSGAMVSGSSMTTGFGGSGTLTAGVGVGGGGVGHRGDSV